MIHIAKSGTELSTGFETCQNRTPDAIGIIRDDTDSQVKTDNTNYEISPRAIAVSAQTTGELKKMMRIEEILPLLQGEFICVVNSEEKAFRCKEDFEKAGLYKNHIVSSLSAQEGKLVLDLTPWQMPTTDLDSEWAKEYTEKNGTEPNFF